MANGPKKSILAVAENLINSGKGDPQIRGELITAKSEYEKNPSPRNEANVINLSGLLKRIIGIGIILFIIYVNVFGG